MMESTRQRCALVPICGERTCLPPELAAFATEFAAPGSHGAEVQRYLRCCLQEHDETDHDHYAYVLDLDGPDSGSVWTSWVRGEAPECLVVLQDCPAVSAKEDGRQPCCEFLNHPGQHTWHIDDPRSGGSGDPTAASQR
ncbi:hypothetical protein [Actinacidiphila bryophytorum]|uniref:hypothetical protein n=1 Tax=Actinacidiphila bryophytorum TaxID=1436133 RepID=UPI002176DAFB|nr:hypothetical protein [Actinacidiphila bryophytorum]UWE08706.1 hypothetical protein NYE86_08220 [Actinacidiphila bryophytorum]